MNCLSPGLHRTAKHRLVASEERNAQCPHHPSEPLASNQNRDIITTDSKVLSPSCVTSQPSPPSTQTLPPQAAPHPSTAWEHLPCPSSLAIVPPAAAREPSGAQHPFLPLRLAPSVFHIHNSAGDGLDHPGFISPSADTTTLTALPLSYHCAFGWEKEPGLKTCEQSQDN